MIETYQRISRRRVRNSRLGSLIHRGIWGLCDQAFISATNFVMTVVLARNLDPTNFGAFTLVYAVIFFVNTFQSALVTRPHNVVGTTYHDAEYRQYTTATAMSQIWLTGSLALVALLCAVVAHRAAWSIAPLLVPLVPTIIAWQLQEFFRRVLYTEGRLKDAFVNDVVSYGGQVVSVIALGHFGQLTSTRALSIVTFTSAIAAAWGWWAVKESLDRREIRKPIREKWLAENWRFGKWIFGALIVSSASGQLYTALLAGLVSIAKAGVLRAIITVLGPAHILLVAMETALPPAAARVYDEKGQSGLHSFIARIVVMTAPLMAAYCILVSIFAKPILGMLFGDQYRQYGWLLTFLVLSYALVYLQSPVLIALDGRRASAPVFHANLWAGLIGLTLGVIAIHLFGLFGAGLGLIVEPVIANVVLWRHYRRITATRPSEAIR